MLGLTEKQVKENKSKYGSNIIISKNKNSFFKLLIESLGDPIIKILLIALAIKVVFLFKDFDFYETIGILIAIFLASFISSISEYGSNKAFERLMEESLSLNIKVYRSGILKEIPSEDIVYGDVIKLTSGDKVPADGQIISGSLSVDESFLTGEAREVYKKCSNNIEEKLVYSGSVVYKGDALVLVTGVGLNTKMGKISVAISDKNEESPLKSKLRILAKSISKLGYIGAVLASITYLFVMIVVKNNYETSLIINDITNIHLMADYFIYCLTLSVTIIIMAVPEGLPMMITLVLSSNMKRMTKQGVLVRKMVGIETSGSLNVLLCDKTGTLTEGKLDVKYLMDYEGKLYQNIDDLNTGNYSDILKKSLFYNNESAVSDNKIIGGNTTDKAIMKFLKNIKYNDLILEKKEFDSESKYSYVKVKDRYFYKGASEVLLKNISTYLDKNGNEKVLYNIDFLINKINEYTDKGYRVLVNCYGKNKDKKSLTFINLIVIADKVRKNAKDTIKEIQSSGIKVVMITGDAKKTAVNIAGELGIIKSGDICLTHDELASLTDYELTLKLNDIAVIARALPEDKSRLVNLYKSQNLIVGMTGDGINDTLALKKADVGFSLGSGSEVAKEASDIVLLDDNVSSIASAILYGRTIFKSIRKFITYQLTVNICALFLSIIGVIIGVATPITIIQMLWLNMIMDTFAGLAFSYEAPLKKYMKEKPKSRDEKIINKYMINQIVVNGVYSSALCVLFLKLDIIQNFYGNEKTLMTAFFALFIFLGIINSFLSRTHEFNIFSGILKNKVFIIINIFIFIIQIYIIYYGGDLFRTYGLKLNEILLASILALSILVVDLARKIILKCKNENLGM